MCMISWPWLTAQFHLQKFQKWISTLFQVFDEFVQNYNWKEKLVNFETSLPYARHHNPQPAYFKPSFCKPKKFIQENIFLKILILSMYG